jgi:hypothetical protein
MNELPPERVLREIREVESAEPPAGDRGQ